MLEPGASYVFFIQPEWDPANARSMDPWVLEAWPMATQESVRTPLEGEVSISALAKVLAHTPHILVPTPRPTASP